MYLQMQNKTGTKRRNVYLLKFLLMSCFVKRLEKNSKTALFFSLILVIEMKTKALHRLDSVKLDHDESDSELEMVDSVEVQASEVRLTGVKDVT